MQSWFRVNHSTITVLLKVTTDVMKDMDDIKMTYLCLLDYTQSLSTVNRELLYSQLTFCGNCGANLDFVRSYWLIKPCF